MITGGALLQVAPPCGFTLEESADRILSGTNSQVEVQFITPVRSDRIGQGEPNDPLMVHKTHVGCLTGLVLVRGKLYKSDEEGATALETSRDIVLILRLAL